MDLIFPFLGFTVIVIAGGIIFSLGLTARTRKTSSQTVEGTDFIPSQMFMGKDNLGGIAISEHTHQICLFKSPESPPLVLPITDLIGVFLVNNGEMLREKKRTYPQESIDFFDEVQIPKEGLVQSLHIESTQGPTQRIDLVILIHDENEPIHLINFLNMETKEGGIVFEKAITTAKHWQNVMEGLLFQADQLAKFQATTPQQIDLEKISS